VIVCRQWEALHGTDATILPFEEWVKGAVRSTEVDVNNSEDMDRLLLTTKPSQIATRYTRMKAFGNHFRVADESSRRLMTYDSGIASVFHVPMADAEAMSVNYVGVLQDILQLDYGPLHSPIILLRCEWMKRHDNRGNPTYVRDEAGFLVVSFRHKLPRLSKPFIFASQATQVFFSEEPGKPGWKVVLRKEAQARREVVDTSDAFISTSVQSNGLRAPEVIPTPPSTASLVGAVELSPEDTRLASLEY
jgi:hypothetical protein